MIRYVWILIIGLAVAGAPPSASGQASKVVARGAQLWNATCNRCHNRRSPTERTDREWDVIVTHMRTQANLTKEEVQAIAAFLKQANESETQAARRPSTRPTSDSTGASPSKTGADTQGQIGQRRETRSLSGELFGFSVLGRRLFRRVLQTNPPGWEARPQ